MGFIMTHMVFMKFEKGYFDNEVFSKISEAFTSLANALPDEILSVSLRKNCVDRKFNMDMLIEMKLRGEDSLGIYLNHPIHLAIGDIMNPHITDRASFDYED